ncbi:MAG TPA: hypothetical protein VIG52_07415 [Methyloceanibacter sp.]
MKARRLIEGSLYEPETLNVVFQAFDQAWAEIAGRTDAFGVGPLGSVPV